MKRGNTSRIPGLFFQPRVTELEMRLPPGNVFASGWLFQVGPWGDDLSNLSTSQLAPSAVQSPEEQSVESAADDAPPCRAA
jgi:hypothetical protein